MIHGLLRREAGDGRKDAEGICGEEEHVLRMAANTGDHSVVDEFDGIGSAGIFGVANVGVIGNAGGGIEHHILEHRSVTDRVKDLRLLLLGEVDALGVAAAFEIEDAGGTPSMFVVADEMAQRIGGEGGLAGPGEAEEQRRFAVVADVGGAMHGEDVAVGQQIIHDAEDRLLHFAGVLGASNEDDVTGEVGEDECAGAGAISFRLGVKLGRGDHGEFGNVRSEFTLGGPDEELLYEERVPRVFRDDADGQLIRGVGTGKQIEHKQFPLAKVIDDALQQGIEFFRGEGLVDLAPVCAGTRKVVFHQEFIAGGASGSRPGKGYERAVRGLDGIAAGQRGFNQLLGGKISLHAGGGAEIIETFGNGSAAHRAFSLRQTGHWGTARIIVPLTAQRWQKWRWFGCRTPGKIGREPENCLDNGERWQPMGLADFLEHGVEVLQNLLDADGVELAGAVQSLLDGALEIMPGGLSCERVGDDLAGALFLLHPGHGGQGDPDGSSIDVETNVHRIGMAGGDGDDGCLPGAVEVFAGPAVGYVEVFVHRTT